VWFGESRELFVVEGCFVVSTENGENGAAAENGLGIVGCCLKKRIQGAQSGFEAVDALLEIRKFEEENGRGIGSIHPGGEDRVGLINPFSAGLGAVPMKVVVCKAGCDEGVFGISLEPLLEALDLCE